MNMLPRVFTPKQMLKHVYLESSERLRPATGLEHWNGSIMSIFQTLALQQFHPIFKEM